MRRHSLLLLCSILLTSPVYTAEPRIVLSSTEDLRDITIAQDGKTVFYVREESGTPQLFRAPLIGTRLGAPSAIAPHPGGASAPAPSADGRRLAFVSRRENALGDVFLLNRMEGTPQRISRSGYINDHPIFSEDGNTIIYTEQTLAGASTIVEYNIRRGTRSTRSESLFPVNPPYPFATEAQKPPVYLLYADDTDRNGELGEGDRPSAWLYNNEQWRQLTLPTVELDSAIIIPNRESVLVSARFNATLGFAEIPFITRQITDIADLTRRYDEAVLYKGAGSDQAISLARHGALFMDASPREVIEARILYTRSLNRALRFAQVRSESERLLSSIPTDNNELRTRIDALRLQLLIADGAVAAISGNPLTEVRGRIDELRRRMLEAGDVESATDAALILLRIDQFSGAAKPMLAASATELIEEKRGLVSIDLLGQIQLFRIELFEQLGLVGELEAALIELLREGTQAENNLRRASNLLVSVAQSRALNDDRLVLELRILRDRVEGLPYAEAALLLEEGRALVRLNAPSEAESSFRRCIDRGEYAPEPAFMAAQDLAKLRRRGNRFSESLNAWDTLVTALGNSPLPYAAPYRQRAESAALASALEKGRHELRVGDGLLALSTFRRIQEQYPNNADARRGAVTAISTRPPLLRSEVARLKDIATRRNATALQKYEYALALSFLDPDSRTARREIERAIRLDGTVPHFYLLSGFLQEQRDAVARARGGQRVAALESAVESYELALSLLGVGVNDSLRADLLLNSGNVAMQLQQFNRASGFYTERRESGQPFIDPVTELLFNWNSAIAAYRSGDSRSSMQGIEAAIRMLESPAIQLRIDADRRESIHTELIGRRALAAMDVLPPEDAEKLFAEFQERTEPRSLARVRAIRNRAILQELSARNHSGESRLYRLNRAEELAIEALTMVDDSRLRGDRNSNGSGSLIDFSFVLTSDAAAGGARFQLDRDDEERLLRATLARIRAEKGDIGEAASQLTTLADLTPRLNDSNRAYFLAQRAVTQSRLAGLDSRRGDYQEAIIAVEGALAATQFTVAGYPIINASAATRMLAQVAELRFASEELALSRQRSTWWMLGRSLPNDDWALLISAADALEAMRDPADPRGELPAVIGSEQQARLEYVRVLANEAMAQRLEAPTLSLDHTRQLTQRISHLGAAAKSFTRMQELAMQAEDPRESARLAILAGSSLVRLEASLLGDEETLLRTLGEVEAYAVETGFGNLRWWLYAQAAIASSNKTLQFQLAEIAKSRLDETILPSVDSDVTIDLGALLQLATIAINEARTLDNAITAWDAAESWRTQLLRMMAPQSSLVPRNAEERALTASLSALQNSIRNQRSELRRIPWRQFRQRTAAAERLRALEADWVAGLANLEGLNPRLSHALNPRSGSFDDLSVLLEPPYFFESRPVLLLGASSVTTPVAVYTDQTQSFSPFGETSEDALGILLGLAQLPNGEFVRILNSEDFLRSFETLSLRLSQSTLVIDNDLLSSRSRAEIIARMETAATVELIPEVRPTATDVAIWPISNSGETLGSLFATLRSADSIRLSISWDDVRPQDIAIKSIALAAWLRGAGVSEAIINGERWIGTLIDPQTMPDIAEEELAVAQGQLVAAVQAGENAPGVRATERIILLKEAIGERDGLAIDYANHAQLLARLGQFSEALAAAQRSLNLLRASNTPDAALASALVMKADFATRVREWEIALAAYEEAFLLRQSIADAEGAYDALLRRADAFERSGRYQEAIDAAKALRSEAEVRGDVEGVVRADLRQARLYRRYLSLYPEAEEALLQAAATAKENDLKSLYAAVSIDQSRLAQAVAEFEESDDLLDRADSIASELDSEELKAEILLERANSAWLRSDYFSSFSSQQQLLQMPIYTERLDLEIAQLNVSGLTSWAVNDLTRAISELERALAISVREDLDTEIASTSNNIGLIKRNEKNYDEALQWFLRALEIDRLQGNRWGEAYALRNAGITTMLAGDVDGSLPLLREAVSITKTIGDGVNETKSLVALGDALVEAGSYTEARATFMEALQLAETIPIPEMQWRALYGLARIGLATGDDTVARENLERAVDVVDSMRASIRVEEFQNGFLIDKQDLYDTLVSFLAERGEIAAALVASERSRSRNFIDLLGNRQIALRSDADQTALARERHLRTEVERLERLLGRTTEPSRQVIEQQLTRARQEYTDFILFLRSENPELSSFVRVDAVSIEDLQELIDPGTALAIYHLLADRTILWILTADDLDMIEIAQGREEVSSRVLSARLAMQNFESMDSILSQISQMLTLPLIGSIPDGIQRIGIVPHQELHSLPFAALQGAPGRLIIEDRALFYTPSASVLRFTVSRRELRNENERAVAIGNPDVGDPAYNLPFAQKEAERLPFDIPGAIVRTGSQATESWVVENLQNYGIIHIASHGEYRPDAPLFSAVMLAPDSNNDGILTAEEIFGLQIRADLVALSACQTGLGRVTAGDDIIGLNRAFVYAGTRQLMTTLWRVDDISTAILFKYFYRRIDESDRAEALRQAQLQLRARPEYRHPAHWSGLILSGDWE